MLYGLYDALGVGCDYFRPFLSNTPAESTAGKGVPEPPTKKPTRRKKGEG